MSSHKIEDSHDSQCCVCKHHPEQQKNNCIRSSISFELDHMAFITSPHNPLLSMLPANIFQNEFPFIPEGVALPLNTKAFDIWIFFFNVDSSKSKLPDISKRNLKKIFFGGRIWWQGIGNEQIQEAWTLFLAFQRLLAKLEKAFISLVLIFFFLLLCREEVDIAQNGVVGVIQQWEDGVLIRKT